MDSESEQNIQPKVLVIGITGCSRSGKTRLANYLKTMLPTYQSSVTDIEVVSQDDFWYQSIGASEECFECTAWDLFALTLTDKIANMRTGEQTKILIVEGFQLLFDDRVAQLLDIKFLLELPESECIRRRCSENSSINPNPKSIGYCKDFLWPVHQEYLERYVTPHRECLIVSQGEAPIEVQASLLIDAVLRWLT